MVAERTDNYGFTLIDRVADLSRSYNGDLTLIDRLLNVLGQPNDGSSVTVEEPTVNPSLSDSVGGDLVSGVEYFYTYTFFDPSNGLESAPAPESSITLPSDMLAPSAPTLVSSDSGGSLMAGSYSYVISRWVGFQTFETSAVNVASIQLHVADGDDQIVTLTPPDLDGADGYNVYRKRPGMSSYYYIGSVTGSGDFVDDGAGPEDCERFAPVDSNILSGHSVTIDLGGATPYLPPTYFWKVYRSTVSGEYSDTLIATIEDGSTSFVDSGFETGYGTPPANTPVLVPGNVGLRSGIGDPTSLDGNDGDWWIDSELPLRPILWGPKDSGSWPTNGVKLGGGVIAISFLHISNLDLSSAHPFGAFLPPNTLIAELINQDDPSENGTYMTPDDPSTEPLVLASPAAQTLQLSHLGLPVVFTAIISDSGFWSGSHELFVTANTITSEIMLAYQQGTSTLATVVVGEDPDVGFDSGGTITLGDIVLMIDASGYPYGDNGGLYVFDGDSVPLLTLSIISGPGVSVRDNRTSTSWIFTVDDVWVPEVHYPGEWNQLALNSGWIDPQLLGDYAPSLRWRFTDASERRVEFGGSVVYAPGATPVIATSPTPAVIATLPSQALPAEIPILSAYELDVSGTGLKSLADIELDPTTGQLTLSQVIYTDQMFFVPYVTFDVV